MELYLTVSEPLMGENNYKFFSTYQHILSMQFHSSPILTIQRKAGLEV